MLGNKEAVATIAVKDLAAARKFYEGTLGLKVLDAQGSEAVTYQSGGSKVIVYRSQFAGTNQATVANWLVGADIETIVQGLDDRGVRFEHYDLPGTDPPGTPARHGHVQDLLVPRSGRQHHLADEHVNARADLPAAWPHLRIGSGTMPISRPFICGRRRRDRDNDVAVHRPRAGRCRGRRRLRRSAEP